MTLLPVRMVLTRLFSNGLPSSQPDSVLTEAIFLLVAWTSLFLFLGLIAKRTGVDAEGPFLEPGVGGRAAMALRRFFLANSLSHSDNWPTDACFSSVAWKPSLDFAEGGGGVVRRGLDCVVRPLVELAPAELAWSSSPWDEGEISLDLRLRPGDAFSSPGTSWKRCQVDCCFRSPPTPPQISPEISPNSASVRNPPNHEPKLR